MLKRFVAAGLTFVWLFISANGAVTHAMPLPQNKPTLEKNSVTEGERTARLQKMLAAAVRHELLTLPWLYRAIYKWDSPLFRYATRAMPPIHILVENGRATLKGAVASQFESQIAYTAARQVPDIFEVRNELKIDN